MTPAAGRGERSRSGASPSPAGGASPRGGGISAERGPFRTGCTDSCLKHISISGLFADMNAKQLYHDWNADCYYGVVHTGPGRKASDCLKYGKCEKICLQHLPIRKPLEDVAKEFETA